MLAVLMRHWPLSCGARGDPRRGLAKACEVIRRRGWMPAAAIGDPARLAAVVEELGAVLRATARQNKRKRPSTFEPLNDPELLEYSLNLMPMGGLPRAPTPEGGRRTGSAPSGGPS